MLGTTIGGRFKIVSLLGEGGLGTVYKCEQPELKRFAAVKLIHSAGLQDPENRTRFEREARILATISNQHIVGIYSFGVLPDGSPYMAMEYLDGITLSEAIQNGPIELYRCLRIGKQICEGLQAAHKAGIVHRDLKPQNIMLLQQPQPDFVKILDFGLSKLIPKSSALEVQRLTQTGALIGSIHYMSPEICSGLGADERSDVYAVGCILYECLTGEAPLSCDNPVGMLHKHRTELPQPLKQYSHLNSIPSEVELAIFKAIQKEPADRFQSMEEFADALELLCAGRSSELNLNNVKLIQEKPKSFLKPIIVSIACLLIFIGALFAFKLSEKTNQISNSQKALTRRGLAMANADSLITAGERYKAAGDNIRAIAYGQKALLAIGRTWSDDVNADASKKEFELLKRLAKLSEGLKSPKDLTQQLIWSEQMNAEFHRAEVIDYSLCMSRLHQVYGGLGHAARFFKEAIATAQRKGDFENAAALLKEARARAANPQRPNPLLEYYADFCQTPQYNWTGDTKSEIDLARSLPGKLEKVMPLGSEDRALELQNIFIIQKELHLDSEADSVAAEITKTIIADCRRGIKEMPYAMNGEQAAGQYAKDAENFEIMRAIFSLARNPKEKTRTLALWQQVSQEIENASKTRMLNWAYQRLLERNPTQLELDALIADHSVSSLRLRKMMRKIVNLPEYKNNLEKQKPEKKVDLLFETILGRTPDPEGKKFFLEALKRPKLTYDQLLDVYFGSDEFNKLITDRELPERAFQKRVLRWYYQRMLDREPNPTEISFAYTRLPAEINIEKIPFDLTKIAYFTTKVKKMSDSEKVDYYYISFVGRKADPGGKKLWMDRLKADTVQHVTEAFIVCDEAKAYAKSKLQ